MRLLSSIFFIGLSCSSVADEQAEFSQCLVGMQQRAAAEGVSSETVDTVIPGLEFQARVIELDRSQPEFTQSFADYFDKRVSQARIKQGRALNREFDGFLADLTHQYGIPGPYLVAFWGLETNFGSYLGGMPTLDSLVTLACDPRRSEFFTTEFLLALKLMEREELLAEDMRGSWAGAIGHTQFMPSNYLRYAIDGDGDDKIDLWNSRRDALASAANFLSQLGWNREQRWGREVQLPVGYDFSLAGSKQPLINWKEQGLKKPGGSTLPVVAGMEAQLVVPAGHTGPAFLAYDNFDVIMRWNRSTSYALSVGHLADRIAGAGPLYQALPRNQPRLHRSEVIQLQELLLAKGFEVGEIDGLLGPASRAALREFQMDSGLIGDGFPDRKTLAKLGVGDYQ